VVVATLALPLVAELGDSLRVPLTYQGDALLYMPLVKSLHETGDYWTNPRMGAVEGFELYDFPMPESGHFLTLRLLGLATGDWVVTFNLFILMQFPLAALSATWVARRFGAAILPAAAAGVLYAYVPHQTLLFHQHVFLACMYPIPLALWLAVRVFQGASFVTRDSATGRVARPWVTGRLVVGVAVCAMVSCTGAYYAFFAAALLAVAGVSAVLVRRTVTAPLPAVGFVLLLAAGVWLNLLPHTQHLKAHGPNPVLKRTAVDANSWALRPAELLLPSPNHRSKKLAKVSAGYTESFHWTVNPNTVALAPLGAVGAVGLLVGLFAVLRRPVAGDDGAAKAVGVLLVVALLVAAPGGFGPLFSHFVSPWIRCYHRMSMFVAFLAHVSLALALSRLVPPTAGWVRRSVVGGCCLGLVGVGLYDQTPRTVTPSFAARRDLFQSEREFVGTVERELPVGAAVFQLPFMAYPEPGVVGEIEN
jgi:phosphoglycerol transferase